VSVLPQVGVHLQAMINVWAFRPVKAYSKRSCRLCGLLLVLYCLRALCQEQ
jgi:hypothetical protein